MPNIKFDQFIYCPLVFDYFRLLELLEEENE